jgi:predicted dehydrogenase
MGYRDCFAALVADVYDAVRDPSGGTGSEAPDPRYPTFADAARTARITDAVLRSSRTRSWIEVL